MMERWNAGIMDGAQGKSVKEFLVLIAAHRSDLVRLGPAGWDVRDGMMERWNEGGRLEDWKDRGINQDRLRGRRRGGGRLKAGHPHPLFKPSRRPKAGKHWVISMFNPTRPPSRPNSSQAVQRSKSGGL